eukprot:TRINITY_DN2941_c0_g1_i1.p2 TRINITY_DN2941_c0_g1~~TRINITY_DN2941_c0_g1_i1.p2  ORF type:complete len:147 (+),score=12.40 TRINITY_DN2941_c0_g1_i1:184-624(+)
MAGLLVNQLFSAQSLSVSVVQTRRFRVQAAYSKVSPGKGSGSNSSANQLTTRLDALHAKVSKVGEAAASKAMSEPTSSPLPPSLSPFRARINDWWNDHLENKAQMVQATAPQIESDDEEDTLILRPPVEVDSKFQLPQTSSPVNSY